MAKGDDNNFSKSFKHIEMFWVPKEEIPTNHVVEKECRKIPQVKSYMASATKENLGVRVRDSSCYNCENCMQGNSMTCTSVKNGDWLHHIVKKSVYARQKIGNTVEYDENDTDDEHSEEELVYNSEDDDDSGDDDDCEDEMEEIPNVSDLFLGRYVLYKYLENRFYVGSVIGQS